MKKTGGVFPTGPVYNKEAPKPTVCEMCDSTGKPVKKQTEEELKKVETELTSALGVVVAKQTIQAAKTANVFREKHGIPPVAVDVKTTEKAQKYVQDLVAALTKKRRLAAADTADQSGCGQNLYKETDPKVTAVTTDRAVAAWYAQKEFFDYTTGKAVAGKDKEAREFIQVIYRDTKKVGFGVAHPYVVGWYCPKANFDPEALKKQVAPPKPEPKPVVCSALFVDCSKFGGYDPKDQCKQTCRDRDGANDANNCQNSCRTKAAAKPESEQYNFYRSCQQDCQKVSSGCVRQCQADMSAMRFINEETQKKWYAACQLKCKADADKGFRAVQEDKIMCTANYVDCSANGGYDPRDPCKQKCVSPLKGRADSAADTLASEVNA